MRLVWRSHPSCRLVVCGSGPLASSLAQEAAAEVREGRAEFLGFVDESRKRALLAARPILAVPSLEASSGDVEGLPVALLEGMAAGCAVVASRTGGTAEAFVDGESGIALPPGDAQALAAAIEDLLDHPQKRSRIERAALETGRGFTWERTGDAYEAIFKSVAPTR